MQALAHAGSWNLLVAAARTESELDMAFASLKQMKAEGVLWITDQFLSGQYDRIAALTARYALPGISTGREFVEAGGLISYGSIRSDGLHQLGVYAGRILKGEKPSELPVVQPTRFETVLNLKTARALGIEVPTATLLRADEVIE